jgi:hypothetical protein
VFDEPFFKKVALAGLNSLGQKIVKNWIFDDPIHKKGSLLVILVPIIQSSGSVIFLMK